MASNIIPSNIDVTYPVAGQDNDSQGFRDNFTNISSNFSVAATEITQLQNTVFPVIVNVGVGGTSTLSNIVQLANLTQQQIYSITSPANGMMAYNQNNGNIMVYTSHLGRWGNVVVS
jgi:hypothetical protein